LIYSLSSTTSVVILARTAIEMYSLDNQLTDAVEEGKVPHVIVSATNRDGTCHSLLIVVFGSEDELTETQHL
jgi:hypothetical protein